MSVQKQLEDALFNNDIQLAIKITEENPDSIKSINFNNDLGDALSWIVPKNNKEQCERFYDKYFNQPYFTDGLWYPWSKHLDKFQTGEISINEVYPHVYHLNFKSRYNSAMHFLRFQEFYESPKYHRQFFTLVDYMEWYSLVSDDAKGSFTYPTDWSGFNVPSKCLLPFINEPSPIPDKNKYDEYMCNLIRTIREKEKDHDFYFIGTSDNVDKENVLDHELSHAWYTVDDNYRTKSDNLLNELNKETLEKAREALQKTQYHISVIDDEIVAYCSTGLSSLLKGVISEEERKPFIENFQYQMKNC